MVATEQCYWMSTPPRILRSLPSVGGVRDVTHNNSCNEWSSESQVIINLYQRSRENRENIDYFQNCGWVRNKCGAGQYATWWTLAHSDAFFKEITPT